ncbi:MAG TPA: magnesium-translocating P-type ATPase [Petrimonas sp.]|uniref:magnesium-translocating P-type ATPase n=1 Tax=Petrimonas sp. TaxID=2023866 RepID=UPI0009607FF2|nr:MAG: magnesium-translocating P-type ATPase [Bacteroidia bacterium 43-41]HHV84531.1 magnesium-translocating P-type ATPase [Petrimonas sp.]
MKLFGRNKKRNIGNNFNSEKLFLAASQSNKQIYSFLNSRKVGLYSSEAAERLKEYGKNEVVSEKNNNWFSLLIKAFFNPFIGILMFLALISIVLDVFLAAPDEREWMTVIIITTMVTLSGLLRFSQEWKSNKASEALKKMVTNKASVFRKGAEMFIDINISDLVPGDVIFLSAGDMIPADVRITEAKDLFVSQSSLTGESDAVEKTPELQENTKTGSVIELNNICFMGSNVISGAAKAVVVSTGNDTYLGTIAKSIVGRRAQTSFDKGINNVSLLLIRFMLVMVPFVFFINGFTKGDWFEAFIFAISVAVGLTPEMLPMIVTSNLAKGAVTMAKRKTIIKNLNSIQGFGAMNILCTDKTGTLTLDKIVLERYLDMSGKEDVRVLRHAYFNSFFQTGLKNLMDQAILSHTVELGFENLEKDYTKIDEIPFDFTRRRMSVVVEDAYGKCQIITKGAVEEMLNICSHIEINGKVVEIDDKLCSLALLDASKLNKEGLRVIALAHKSWVEKDHSFDVADESDMVLIGLLAFLDPPKASASSAIKQLHEHGVEVKVLSGDTEGVVKTICRQVGVDTEYTLTGSQIENMSDEELSGKIVRTKVFAKLTPMQKTRIIKMLQEQGNTVGFLGDGINDASALRQSDIGISVDTAVDIAKESADIILLEKDLMVLEEGVIEGRKIFGNIMKYIKMTASSNFGNMFSVLVASAFLPFLPMLPIHLLIQNLLYDISQITIPFDNVDKEYLAKPRKWDASDLKRFMIHIGPISSIFDIATYLVMWYVFHCTNPDMQSLFQSGWFIEGLLSQTLIVHMIRTRKIPFIQSRASRPVMITTFAIMAIGIAIPFTSLGASIGLTPLPWTYFPWLVGILLGYCFLTQILKGWYVKKYQRWL